jgi:hypothetical protein
MGYREASRKTMTEVVKSLLEGTRCNGCYIGTLVYEGVKDYQKNTLTCTACNAKITGELK